MNRLYSEGRKMWAQAQWNWISSAFSVAMTSEAFNDADTVISNVTRIGSSFALSGKGIDAQGRCYASPELSLGSPSGGGTVIALVLFQATGTDSSSRLCAYIDSGISGLPFVANGSPVKIQWPAWGIFIL